MTRLRFVDLFCGAGGAAMGYHRAAKQLGIVLEIVGVDVDPQPSYPFEFVQADALTFPLDGFDGAHASPPCQAYGAATVKLVTREAPKLIEPIRARLLEAGLPYAIENVVGAPLIDPLVLCGSMFGLDVKRHRLFETSFPIMALTCQHKAWINRYPTHARKDKAQFSPVVHIYGTGGGAGKDLGLWKRVMDVPWMQSKSEVAEAIPPAYTEYVGLAMLEAIARTRSAA